MEITGDFAKSDDYKTEIDHFETYKSKTSEFFGDFEAFEQIPKENRIEIIENWIASGDIYGLPEDAQIHKVTRLIVDEVMNPNLEADQTVVMILPNASGKVAKKVSDSLKPIGVTKEKVQSQSLEQDT